MSQISDSLVQRWQAVRAEIDSLSANLGRPPARLVAVSKQQSLPSIETLYACGQRDFGENYVQEWQTKRKNAIPELRWHFIGHLQTNKVKEVVGEVEWIHGVDSLKLAEKIAERAARLKIRQKVLFQINLVGEAGKSGFSLEDFLQCLPRLANLEALEARGLMAIPPDHWPSEPLKEYFMQVKKLVDQIAAMELFADPWDEISMGMSQDWRLALECGSTCLRIGTAIFGARP